MNAKICVAIRLFLSKLFNIHTCGSCTGIIVICNGKLLAYYLRGYYSGSCKWVTPTCVQAMCSNCCGHLDGYKTNNMNVKLSINVRIEYFLLWIILSKQTQLDLIGKCY